MANVIQERNTDRMGDAVLPILLSAKIAANTKIFKGAMVGLSTAAATKGQAVKGGASTAQSIVGIAEATVDNTGGAAEAMDVPIRAGVFKFANSAAADAIDKQHIGQVCYAVDDQTVALGDNGGARPEAGVIVAVTSDGVYVMLGIGTAGKTAGELATFMIDFIALTNAQVLQWTPRFAGKIKHISMSVSRAAAGAGGTCTMTTDIGGTPLTGGVLTPTLGTATQGAELNATAITGANQFKAGDVIHVVGSATTVFTAGNGTMVFHLG